MDARVIFTKNFQDSMNKKLSAFEIGKLRWEKLKELEESGKLESITNRYDLCRAIGMNEESIRGIGTSWVSNLLRRKHLHEYKVYLDGKIEKRYKLGKTPSYKGIRRKRSRKPVNLEKMPMEEYSEALYEKAKVEPKAEVIEKSVLIIEKNGMKFTFDGDFDIEFVMEVAKRLYSF